MIRKMISILLISTFTASVTAQDGWAHTVQPVFNEPFHELLLPWNPQAVQARPVSDCWVNEEPPFLGSEWRFWCYTVPEQTGTAAASTLDAAYDDHGEYLGTPVYSTYERDGMSHYGSRWTFDQAEQHKFYVFHYSDRVLIGLAAFMGKAEPLNDVEPVPVVEPDPEPGLP